MSKMMRPGIRVIRGQDWHHGVEDGNGHGTVLSESPHSKNLWKVKWDNNFESAYFMGFSEKEGKNVYRLKIIEITAPKRPLGNKLFMAKNTFDLKIICEGKILECHRNVVCCQSDVFDVMFLNDEMSEAQSKEVKINDIQANTMETFLYFLYHDQVQDTKMINAKLLRAAHKYNVLELMEVCTEYLKKNLSFENATDVLVSAHLTDQKDLFEIASDFVKKNEGNLVKTTAWDEFKKTNPTMAIDIFSSILKL
jgi:hypothetical protein